MGRLLLTVASIVVVSLPLAITIWALLDVASRASWVWAFAHRNRLAWMIAILFGSLLVLPGLVISTWYLRRVRPQLAAIEQGRITRQDLDNEDGGGP